MEENARKSPRPRPEVSPTQPWETEAETPIADARTDSGAAPRKDERSVLGNTALGEASLGNTLPDLPTTDMGDPILTGPLVSDPFSNQ